MNPTGKKFISLFLVFLLLIISPVLEARICSREKPLPERKKFWITEVGGIVSLTRNIGEFGANYEFGLMYNKNRRSALGATLYFGLCVSDMVVEGFGIKARYRRWLSSSFSVDISPGLLILSEGKDPDFTGHVGLNYKDSVALVAQADFPRSQYRKANLSLGIKLGSQAGKALFATSAIVGAVVFVILAVSLGLGQD